MLVFYLIRGTIRVEAGRSGRTLLRFSAYERFVHWMTAVCFIILAISGLNITFGRELLLPIIGPEAFTTWSQWGKYAHNYLSFPFTLGVVLTFLMWLTSNLPTKADIEWIKKGGGMVGHEHPPAGRFNPGQKLIYWLVVVGGSAVAVTGYLLMFPFYGTGIAGMQTAQIIHAIVGVLFIAGMLVHIYMGTLGEEGAFESMTDGTVDENWAKQHHSIWYEEEKAKGNVAEAPARRRRPDAAGGIAHRRSTASEAPGSSPGVSCCRPRESGNPIRCFLSKAPWRMAPGSRCARPDDSAILSPCASSASPAGAVPARQPC